MHPPGAPSVLGPSLSRSRNLAGWETGPLTFNGLRVSGGGIGPQSWKLLGSADFIGTALDDHHVRSRVFVIVEAW